MKHERPNIEEIRAKFDKDWFPYDFQTKPWQGELGFPTMGESFTDTCQRWFQLDMMSVWNEEDFGGTYFKLYQLCRHNVYIWLDLDYTNIKSPDIDEFLKKWFEARTLKWNQYYEKVVARPRIVLLECLAGEVLTMVQGRVDLAWNFYKRDEGAYMMNAVEVEHCARFNSPKEFIIP